METILVDLIKDPIIQYIVSPIKQHTSYAFNCDGKVERLQNEVDKLQNKRVRLQQSVDEASRNGEEIYPNVTQWLITVQNDIEEAEELIQRKEEAMKKCFTGFCPNLKTRYLLSKKADKKAFAIDKQLLNLQGLDPISFCPPAQPIVEPSVYTREALPSRVRLLNQIMDALKDPNLNLIGVHGMGGVGKTTLAKEVLGQALKDKLFDTVVMVPVSQTPDMRRIQGELAGFLNLQFNAEEILGRASQLHQRLKNGKVLIILDDLWQKLDLNAVGIPFGDASEGCKILLTSRRKDVLSNEMCTQKEFPLDVLEEEETWRLFEMSVNKAKDPELNAIAIEVAKRCAGLPLLILKVATDLQNKESYAWSDMLNRLSSLEGTEIYEKVHKVIESSYEKLLDEEAKSLFLLCALFGNSNIRIHLLLIYCMGLGLFKHVYSIEGARNRVLSLIDKLKDVCLLLDGDMVGFVKIHDVVRDVALAIASRVQHAFVGVRRVRSRDLRSKHCTRISIPYCDFSELPEVLECPEAEVFSLLVGDLRIDIPNSFFEGVTKLKVLHFTGVHFVSGLPSSLGFLTSLQTLNLDICHLDSLAIVAELKHLELLSLAYSNIAELPREIKALTRLKLLDLSGCRDLEVIPENVLSNLCLLEELYMLNSFHGWGVQGNASLMELKNLSYLTTLEIQVKDDKLLPDDWFFNGLQNYKILIGEWDLYPTEYGKSRILKLDLKTSTGLMDKIKEFLRGTEVLHLGEVKEIEILLHCSGMQNLKISEKFDCGQLGIHSFEKLRILLVQNCDTLKNLFPFSCAKCFQQLQEIQVENCGNMEAIVGEGGEDEVIEFTQLTSLKLITLPHLIGFCKTSGTVSFPSLTSLEIYQCNSLKYVFTPSMVKSLKQLKELEIRSCQLMEEIILSNEIEGESIVFPELDFLELSGLEKLKRFSSVRQIEFPGLSKLRIKDCCALNNFVSRFSDRSNNNESIDDQTFFNELVTFSNLEELFLEDMDNWRYLWHHQFADDDSFSKLKLLRIENCSNLSVVFPSNVYRRFQRLESLNLISCDGVEEIYEHEEANISQACALKKVYICGLPSLKHIWNKDMDEAVSFPNLQSIIVLFCEGLKYVFPASIASGLLQLQKLIIGYCGLQMLIAEPKNAHTFEWPKLKRLDVCDCDQLINLGYNISNATPNIPTQGSDSFFAKVIPRVESLQLDRHSLKAIQSDGFPGELMWKLKEVTLHYLEEESISYLCGFLRGIYSLEGLVFVSGYSLGETFSLDAFNDHGVRLKRLQLRHVINLKHIVKKDSQLSPILEYLQTLSFIWCDDLINIASSSASFQYLTILEVERCGKMTSLVTASTAKSMIQLTELRVSNCEMLKEIVVHDEGDCSEHHVVIFKKLKLLELYELPILDSFCSCNSCTFNFPLLEQVYIDHCNQMKIFCGSTPKIKEGGNLNDIVVPCQLLEDGLADIS